jgi:tetratricopeptide (TPR) repeat protein
MLDRLKAMQAAGTLDAAEAIFRRITEAAPETMRGWLGLGYCASLKGAAEAAMRAFAKAVAVCPNDEAAAIACAQALGHQGAFDAARAILSAWPMTVAQQMALGALAEQAGAWERAQTCYGQASVLDPRAEPPVKMRVKLYCRGGDHAAAAAVVAQWAALDPRHEATAWRYRGQIHRAAQNRAAAIGAFQRALALAPQTDAIAIDLSQALRDAGRDKEAHAVLAGRRPCYAVLLALGDLALARRQHEAALGHFAAAQAMEPRRPEPLLRSARVEADRAEFAAAQAMADRIDAIGPEHRLIALRSRLDTLKAAGDAVGALGIAEQMAALAEGDAGVFAELARHYRLAGDVRAARRTVQRALAGDARNVPALVEAAEQAIAAEDREAALRFCRRVLAIAPEAPSHAIRLARLLYDMDRGAEAEQVLATAEARCGPSAELCGERIRLLRDAGDVHAALDAARRAHAAFPAHFGRWSDRFQLELRLSSIAEAAACLDDAPVRTGAEEARRHLARAQLARRAWDIRGAITQLEAALRWQAHHRAVWVMLFELHLLTCDVTRAADCFARVTALEASGRRMRGVTTNASQSFNGQILNEFLLDRRAIAAVAEAQRLDPAAAVEKLLALVEQRPAHVPTAFGLLIALRRAGLLDRDIARPALNPPTGGIPRKIGQFWDKPRLSEELLELSASWRRHNPDHRYYLFNADTARNYLRRYFPPAVALAYRRCPDPTTQADLFRLAFLLRDGGVWADMDDRCLTPLASFVPAGVQACFRQEAPGSIGNNFIAAMPGHPILRRALVTAVNAINRGDRDKVWMLTGPGLLSRAFALDLAAAGEGWTKQLARVAVLDDYDLYPHIAINCRTAHKRLGAHWTRTAFAGSGHRPAASPDHQAAAA